jgi:hypothetical protein
MVKAKKLDTSRYEVTNSIRQTDIERLARLANLQGKGWPLDPEAQTPYSFVRNVSFPAKRRVNSPEIGDMPTKAED